MYKFNCNCGQEIAVRASDAGTEVMCECGIKQVVPKLSALEEVAEPPASNNVPGNEDRTPQSGNAVDYGLAALLLGILSFAGSVVFLAILAAMWRSEIASKGFLKFAIFFVGGPVLLVIMKFLEYLNKFVDSTIPDGKATRQHRDR